MQAATSPHVNVLVLNWNGKDDTLRCLDSLTRMSYANFRVTVIDNGSSDGSVEAVRDAYPQVEVLCTGANLGYAGGNNVGLRACLADGRSQYALVLNNDTVVDEALLDELVRTADASDPLTVLGPMIFFEQPARRIWFAGAYWNDDLLKFEHLHHRQVVEELPGKPYESDYVTGCAMFFSVDTLRRVGLLDERFFLIYEEVDWCFRLRKLGGRCLVVPNARVSHSVSASFGGEGTPLIQYFTARNELLWAERALALRERIRLLASALVSTALPEAWHTHRPPIPLLKRIYWSLMSGATWNRKSYGGVAYRCRTAGFRDYVLRRFGDCPAAIRLSR